MASLLKVAYIIAGEYKTQHLKILRNEMSFYQAVMIYHSFVQVRKYFAVQERPYLALPSGTFCDMHHSGCKN